MSSSSKVDDTFTDEYFIVVYRWQKTEKRLMDGGFLELNAEETEAEVEEFSREMYKLTKVFTTKAKHMKKDRDLGGQVCIVYV